MENLEKKTLGQEKFDKKNKLALHNMLKKNLTKKNVQTYVGKKSYLKKLLCWKKKIWLNKMGKLY